MTALTPELEEYARALIVRLLLERDARLSDAFAELRDDVHSELADMVRRIDAVHTRALRELTRLHERRL